MPKKKDLTPEEKRTKVIKKTIRQLKRNLFIIAITVILYSIYNPAIIPHPLIKDRMLQVNQSIKDQNIQDKVVWLLNKIQEKFLIFAENVELPKNFSSLPKEIDVENVVDNLGKQVKDLPQQEVKKIKTRFCQDVINDATATVAGIKTEP